MKIKATCPQYKITFVISARNDVTEKEPLAMLPHRVSLSLIPTNATENVVLAADLEC